MMFPPGTRVRLNQKATAFHPSARGVATGIITDETEYSEGLTWQGIQWDGAKKSCFKTGVVVRPFSEVDRI